ncbi:MAG TPA: hypothetical protein VM032_17950 [Vicinamibacterales bacterium]|nr:hypothetical protein [Vicinamibacterales bacterium]
MSSSVGTLVRHAALTACLSVAAGSAAFAQNPHPLAEAPAVAEFMPRFDWKMSAALLAHPDPRFTWDTHWAGDLDLFRYPRGRASFLADYQALLGSQFRPFDPYQGNYLLEASGSVFAGRTEIAGVLSHISRHLGDRPKRIAVAENSLGPRLMRRLGSNEGALDVRIDVRKVIARAYDDYTWIEELELVGRRQVTRRAGIYLRGYGQLIQVDPAVAGRSQQRGGRVEAGVRLQGLSPGGAAMELFGGGEQVIDADPLDRLPRRWAYVGFRLLGH